MKSDEVGTRSGYQRSQFGNQIFTFEYDRARPIAPWTLQPIQEPSLRLRLQSLANVGSAKLVLEKRTLY